MSEVLLQDPTVDLGPWSYGGPGGGVFYSERNTSLHRTVWILRAHAWCPRKKEGGPVSKLSL